MASLLAMCCRSTINRTGSQYVGHDASQRSAMPQSSASTFAAIDGKVAIGGDRPVGDSATGGYHHRQKVCQPVRLKSTTSHLMYMALSLQAFDAYGLKPEGLAHPLPGSKAPEMVKNEIERPERPTRQHFVSPACNSIPRMHQPIGLFEIHLAP